MNPRTIAAIVRRYLYLYTRNKIRLVELTFWPIVSLLLWGFLTVYLQNETSGDFPHFIRFLIGAMIFWDVLFRSQQAVAMSFLEDVWTRNLLNIFVAPVRLSEFLVASFIIGIMRTLLIGLLLSVLSYFLYAFNILELEFTLFPYLLSLMIFGWSLGMISTAFIMRWGLAAEMLAWAIPFLVQPFSAVFYPVAALPSSIQILAWALPSTYVFEGMRATLDNGHFSVSYFMMSMALNVLFFAIASAVFLYFFREAKQKALLTKIATQ